MVESTNWLVVLKEAFSNLTSDRLVEFAEVDIEGHCIECEQALDDYHLKECSYYGCSLRGRKDCVCDG